MNLRKIVTNLKGLSLFVQCRTVDKDYGPKAQKPDIDEEIMKKKSEEFLKNLKKTDLEINQIEEKNEITE